jgi:dCMP deaminase
MDEHYRYFLDKAKELTAKSKDPSTKIAAIILDPLNNIISNGYNGFPRKIADTPERLNDRPLKYKLTVHAEANAILNAARSGKCTLGSTIYVSGLPPCHECAKAIIQAGIKLVVFYDIEIPERWQESINFGQKLFDEANIQVIKVKQQYC